VAYLIHCEGRKLGQATDLGKVTHGVQEKLSGVDVLMIEANHDPAMLEVGPYPWAVKRRILGELGHLSNDACAELIASVRHEGLRKVVLMHLSQTNNHPDIARLTASRALDPECTEMILAEQDRPTELIAVAS
jgi:phosphoribosyl 1,2-cyclic phosphodiesterase